MRRALGSLCHALRTADAALVGSTATKASVVREPAVALVDPRPLWSPCPANRGFRSSNMTADTLYERLGGPGKADKAIAAVVDAFYERILANPELAPFFKNTDMVRQAKHQTNFVTFAFGGPNRYSGRAMNAAHKKLRDEHGMSDKHFDLVAQTLAATMLEDFQLDQATVDEAIAIVATTREQVMGRAE